jgi:hypothetical protein
MKNKLYTSHFGAVTAFLTFLFLFQFLIPSIFAQTIESNYWKYIDETLVPKSEKRYIIPASYKTLKLESESYREALTFLPDEKAVQSGLKQAWTISLPNPSGEYERFFVMESSIMEAELAAKFPEFKTYRGNGIDDRSASIRFDMTPNGFHAMVLSAKGNWYIDPYFFNNDTYYLSYWKREFYASDTKSFFMECHLEDDPEIAEEIRYLISQGIEYSGTNLRTYRLALATTGEYTSFHGGTVQSGMSAVVTAMNRVNGVYERDVAVRMILVANNDLIIYTNASTDPYTNNNGSTMLGQNQTNLDNVIGNANYDIGHVFSTGGGGIAGLGVVCRTSLKARGVTGLPSPIGDPFYIDYVAHEMGHQFAANHTFNGSSGSCSGSNRNASTAYEPGSGTTIMAYAGICSPQNIQNYSDDHFHGASLDEIIAYTTLSYGNSCPVITPTGNTPPTVTLQTGGFTIPINTPFALTGSAFDPDNDSLTYCWEQFDLGAAGAPNSPSGNAPIFRSFSPVTTPTRLFPRLPNILSNTQQMGELLPSYTRTLTFRLTARDNRSGGGGVGKNTVSFSANSTGGPFVVTSPNSAVSWLGSTYQNITWDVANTNTSPFNVSNVKVTLSTNGGNSFDVVLSESTQNDGTEELLIPNYPTTAARIKIEALGNIFFDISNANFTIIDNPIPVELTTFSADVVESDVLLKWETATELNNSGFEIERSRDKVVFNTIGFIKGKGNSTERNNYSFIDINPSAGNYYYRLKQVDFNGEYEYSKIIEILMEAPVQYALLQNHPNPFNPSTIITFSVPARTEVSLKIFDILGNEITTLLREELNAGKHEVEFNAVNLANGVYFYEMKTSSFRAVKKLVLMK